MSSDSILINSSLFKAELRGCNTSDMQAGCLAHILTIYAPVIYKAPCVMFWMGAYTLRGEVGGGWALEFPSFLGPVSAR